MQREKDFLSRLTKTVIKNLKEQNILSPFKFVKNQRPSSTNTQGWGVQVGRFYGYGCSAEIWLDKFTAHSNRKIWYGLVWEKNTKKFDYITNLANKKFGIPFKIGPKDIKDEKKVYVLSKQLSKNKFGSPILEKHERQFYYYYGIYEFDQTGLSQDVSERLSLRVTDFFYDIVEVLQKTTQIQNEDYPGIENRKSVRTHIYRERRSHVATLRKQIDNYICEICDLKFIEVYGTIGKNFAEAHHIVPLSSNDEIRQTTIEDLITVCANCHRMLHRMTGKQTDIADLKDIVRKYKKKSSGGMR